MGQVKKLMMDYDETLDNLHGFCGHLNQQRENSEYKHIIDHIVEIINQLEKLLDKCKDNYSVNAISHVNYVVACAKELLRKGLCYDNLNQILDYFVKCKIILCSRRWILKTF